MSNEFTLRNAARVLGPRESAYHPVEAGVTKGEITLAATATSDRIEIPLWLRGQYCEFTALGANVYVMFGDGSVDVVASTPNTLSTETVTFADTVGRPVPSGGSRSWIIPPTITHMAWEADGTGTLHIGPSSEKELS